jgi:hypothetical protein
MNANAQSQDQAVKYAVTPRSQIFIVKELAITACIFVLGFFAIRYLYPGYDIYSAKIFIICYLVIQVMPCLILHPQYYYYNAEMILNIDTGNRTLSIKNGVSEYSYHFHQIKSIKIAMVMGLYRGGRIGFSAWDLYHYAVIETQDERQYVVTCLLINDLRKFFEELGLEIQKEWIIFPLIMMNRYKHKSPDGW